MHVKVVGGLGRGQLYQVAREMLKPAIVEAFTLGYFSNLPAGKTYTSPGSNHPLLLGRDGSWLVAPAVAPHACVSRGGLGTGTTLLSDKEMLKPTLLEAFTLGSFQ